MLTSIQKSLSLKPLIFFNLFGFQKSIEIWRALAGLRDSTTLIMYMVIVKMFQAYLYLRFLVIWFYSLFYVHPLSSRIVNPIDRWLCDRKIKRRNMRIPELCAFLHKKYGKLVELQLLGQRVIIVTDMKIAFSLMTNHGHFLKQRFGNVFGLQNLNMYLTGLIWNNNVKEWKRNRIIFESTLSKGSKNLQDFAISHLETVEKTTFKIAEPDTVLELLRNFTLSMTMESLFGISMPNTPNTSEWREEAKTTVANYFKAWEFYLLNPNSNNFAENELHLRACGRMLQLSEEIFAKAKETGGSNFISHLSQCNNENGTIQCIAEMLLAGTDTSSLTMFYTLLFLADYPEVANNVSRIIHSQAQDTIDMHISHIYFESMRLIPVGPVILRQCETDIIDGKITLKKGDGIIFNIAGINRAHYSQPHEFNPSRYQHGDDIPLTFGTGKKSCVGKTFAEKEMKIFFTWFLRKYTVLGNRNEMVGLLQTRWDIANAPVNDIKLTVFPRITVFFVGQYGTGKSHLLKAIQVEYPRIKVIEQHTSNNNNIHNDHQFRRFQLDLIRSRLELLNTLESEFVLIEGSIVDCLVMLIVAGLNHDYDENELFRLIRKSLFVHFPSSNVDSVRDMMDEEYVSILKRTGCRFLSLKSIKETDRVREIMNFIGGR